jgi:hypothetical protein
MFPKGPCVPRLVIVRGGGNARKWGLVGSGALGCALEGKCVSLFSASFSLLFPGHGVNGFALTCTSTMMPSHRPKQWGQLVTD